MRWKWGGSSRESTFYQASSAEDLRTGISPAEDEGTVAALFVLLDAALGEVDVATRIGPITWGRAPASPALAGLHPFRDLPEQFDAMAPSQRESGWRPP